ncbi:thioesterase family protein [Sphingomonas sp.]|jgi:acyl-CoA thioesterase|uniref:thioesterase family protein n=1 Tax=Sphingomonas sp. TaxID=28214 RepID=UPI0026094D25|nr:thioesterase family protein [Sphingomonas sp.]MDF2602921.1 hypothetical protein [Sphingomonas sp.]
MAGLIEATTLRAAGDGYVATLDRDWEIWGPAGGYLAAIALRAVRERALDGHRPVTLTGQFVRVAQPGELQITVTPLKEGASALYAVTSSQGGQPIFLSQVWTTRRAEPSAPIQPVMPDVPRPAALRNQEELSAERGIQHGKFWKNLEGRPVEFRLHDDPPAQHPNQRRWMRFTQWDEGQGDDLFFDAMRTALLIDLGIWPGHWHRLEEAAGYLAPSLDLTVYFHGSEPAGAWLLSDADSDVSGDGLISGRVRIWSEAGRALATGSGHCLVTTPRSR